MAPTRLYLGVDGGGSVTRARLEDSAGRVLGAGEAGPGNLRLGARTAWQAVSAAMRGALAEAGLQDSALAQIEAGLGMAGAWVDEARTAFLGEPSPFARLVLESDAHAACLGAHAGAPGAVVIVGTGSVGHVWDGRTGREVGGWGFPIGDGGSGAWIGFEAVRNAAAAADGLGDRSALGDAVLAQIGGGRSAAVVWAGRAEPADYAALAPLVLQHAAAGDHAALGIMYAAGAQISRLVQATAGSGGIPVAIVGGLAGPILPWLDAATRSRLVPPKGNALDGALRMIRTTAA
ncbi:MAG TPA: BadF/BadG/BcrA/BcrD ATPase family protein [Candidatus Cybelea sp.]|nr:BadF/BadG/BcrA/BcrD ATPase family protein [Candidatus Cybelea sp.]